MKFFMFNLVVIGALFYMFAADDTDKRKAADFVAQAKQKVEKFVERGKPDEKKDLTPTTIQQAESPSKVLPTPVSPTPVKEKKISAQPVDQSVQALAKVTSQDLPPVTPAPVTSVEKVTLPEKPAAKTVEQKPTNNAAQARRQEIMTGLGQSGTATGEPVLAEGASLMPTSDRQRALRNIAEDMELFYAKTIGQ